MTSNKNINFTDEDNISQWSDGLVAMVVSGQHGGSDVVTAWVNVAVAGPEQVILYYLYHIFILNTYV